MRELRKRHENHGWKKMLDLKAECKHLGLPSSGNWDDLRERLFQAEKEKNTPGGKRLDYQRRLKVQNKAKMANIVSFEYFAKLPHEVRASI